MHFLTTLPWEGNVRELENTIERAAILCTNNKIMPEDVQPDTVNGQASPQWMDSFDVDQAIPPNTPLPDVLHAIEKKMLENALEKADFVQTRAADNLGITKSLLQYKIKKYGLQKK